MMAQRVLYQEHDMGGLSGWLMLKRTLEKESNDR